MRQSQFPSVKVMSCNVIHENSPISHWVNLCFRNLSIGVFMRKGSIQYVDTLHAYLNPKNWANVLAQQCKFTAHFFINYLMWDSITRSIVLICFCFLVVTLERNTTPHPPNKKKSLSKIDKKYHWTTRLLMKGNFIHHKYNKKLSGQRNSETNI